MAGGTPPQKKTKNKLSLEGRGEPGGLATRGYILKFLRDHVWCALVLAVKAAEGS